RRKAELAGQADVAVTAPAGVADVRRVHRGGGVGVFENPVLAVAVGAQRRLGDAARQRLAVHAGPILFGNFVVAHAAGVGNGGAERLRSGRLQFVRAAVAEAAIGSALISV